MAGVTYTYNPACTCQWCSNGGNQPAETFSAGHSWCYEDPHFPPSQISLKGENTIDNVVPIIGMKRAA